MITVRETSPDVFERIGGNPVLSSLDGERKAPLATIISAAWTEEERAQFGIFRIEPTPVPEGKRSTGSTFARQNGEIVQVHTLVDLVPAVVTPRQIRLALHGADLWAQVEAYVATLTDAEKIEWEYAIEVRRDNALIAAAQQALSMTNEQADDLFRLAATL